LQVNFEYFLAIAIQAASTTRSAAALTARSGTAAGPRVRSKCAVQ
jgi:hypothetical protein